VELAAFHRLSVLRVGRAGRPSTESYALSARRVKRAGDAEKSNHNPISSTLIDLRA